VIVVARARERTRGVQEHGGANVGGKPAEPLRGALRSERIWHSRQNSRVPLARISWLVTVGICLIAALLLLLSGYYGYAGVLLAVGASAFVNLI
jgi:ABC-type Na+ efflux pump permease subunit